MASKFTVEHDREWLVLTITRERRGKEPRVRHVYLSLDEAAQVIAVLNAAIPAPPD